MQLDLDLFLYVITASLPEKGRDHIDIAEAAVAGGATVIQYRDKSCPPDHMLKTARELRRLTKKAGVVFIVNDWVDLAREVGADGLHLGQSDANLAEARSSLPQSMIIGLSAGNLYEARTAEKGKADYLGVGPVFFTPSKEDAGDPIGLEMLGRIREEVSLPIVAIGGINISNLEEVLSAGVDGVAVISAVATADDMIQATRDLRSAIEKSKKRMWRRDGSDRGA